MLCSSINSKLVKLSSLLFLCVLLCSCTVYNYMANRENKVTKEQSSSNFEFYVAEINKYFQSSEYKFEVKSIYKDNVSDSISWLIEYVLENQSFSLFLHNYKEIETFSIDSDGKLEKVDGATTLPIQTIVDINNIISGHSLTVSEISSLITDAYKIEPEEESFLVYRSHSVGFWMHWQYSYNVQEEKIYPPSSSEKTYVESFHLRGLTKRGTKD